MAAKTQLKLVIDSIIWAFRHTERNIADTGGRPLLTQHPCLFVIVAACCVAGSTALCTNITMAYLESSHISPADSFIGHCDTRSGTSHPTPPPTLLTHPQASTCCTSCW
jgi:hypothetical protein